MTEEITKPSERGKRGFSAMDPEKHREIASKGGKAVHAQGKAHEFTSEEAREAGRKGAAARMAARGTGGTEIHPSIKVPQETLVGKSAPPAAPFDLRQVALQMAVSTASKMPVVAGTSDPDSKFP